MINNLSKKQNAKVTLFIKIIFFKNIFFSTKKTIPLQIILEKTITKK